MPQPIKSGLRLHYRVETSDGSVIDVKTAVVDMLRYEKAHAGKSWLEAGTVTAQMWVVWCAAKREGLIEGTDPDGWAATVVDFEIVDDDAAEGDGEAGSDALDPTQPAPTAS